MLNCTASWTLRFDASIVLILSLFFAYVYPKQWPLGSYKWKWKISKSLFSFLSLVEERLWILVLLNGLMRFKGQPEGLFPRSELRPVVGVCLTVSWCTVQGFRGSGQEPSAMMAARINRFYDVRCFKCGLLMDDSHSQRMFRLPACLNHRHCWKMSLPIHTKVWLDKIQNYAFCFLACTSISHFCFISETMAKIWELGSFGWILDQWTVPGHPKNVFTMI